jgi:hypothetical protein
MESGGVNTADRRASFAWFVLRALIVYALMMAPWPGLREAHAAVFRGMGNVVFSRFWFWGDSAVRFIDLRGVRPGDLAPGAPMPDVTDAFDTVMELRTRGASQVGYLRTSARYVAYLPIALFTALCVATPTSWRRRGVGLVIGLLLVHLFVLLRLTLTLLAGGFAAEKTYAIFRPGPFWHGVLMRLDGVLADNPTVSYIVPTLIWFVLMFRGLETKKTELRSAK